MIFNFYFAKRTSFPRKETVSRGKKKSYGERKFIAGKEKVSRRKKISHGERKRICLTPKENFSRQNKEKIKNNSD